MASTLRLPDDLEERLRVAAFERRVHKSVLVVEAVRELLDRLDAEAAPAPKPARRSRRKSAPEAEGAKS